MSADVADAVDKRPESLGLDQLVDTKQTISQRLDVAGMCMVNLDHRLCIVSANMEFFRQFGQFGQSSDEGAGRNICDLLHPSVRSRVEQQFSRLLEGQRSRFLERVVVMRQNGTTVSGELVSSAVHAHGGRLDSVTAVFRPEKPDRNNQLACARKKILTEMDARILEGVAAGVSTIQLAANLYLSRGGVEYHVTTLLRKMKVKNRPALISKAYSMGIFGVGSWPPRALSDFVR
jgi:PAS domain S-box-containing protein